MLRNSRVFTVAALGLTLLACSSAPPPSKPTPTVVQQPSSEPTQDTGYFIQQARQTQGQEQLPWLLKAAESLQADDCAKTIVIVQKLLPELTSSFDRTHARLLLAECWITLGEMETATQLGTELNLQQGLDQRIYRVRAASHAHQQQWLAAAEAWLKADIPEPQRSGQIWQWLAKVSNADLSLPRWRRSELQPWVELSFAVRRYGAEPDKLDAEIQNWRRRYNDDQAPQLPAAVLQALQTEPLRPQHIAVVLPLSGRAAAQGEAIRDGILAAYFNDTNNKPKLSFIDVVRQSQALLISEEPVDLVIGPLLKESISAFLATLPAQIPVLALNRVDMPVSNQKPSEAPLSERYFYALAPEDEAEQLAEHMLAQGLKRPLMVTASGNVTERMAESFAQHWQLAGARSPEQLIFNDTESMRDGVAGMMQTAASAERIAEIKRLTNSEVYEVERSRRDLDSVVVFANTGETELINPVIESNISPFAKILPVFASSRSYTTALSKNSLRDLRNLRFTEMPWMLPDNPWQGLAERSQALWPQRSDGEQRLFAMGYDAYNLIPKLRHMALLSELSQTGLTGELRLDGQHQVVRALPLGRIEQDRIIRLAGN